MEILINRDYVFQSRETGVDDVITEDHYWDGRIAEEIWDNYSHWSEINGTVVTVISLASAKGVAGCVDLAKVFLKEEGFEWWFTAKTSELQLLKGQQLADNPCSCDLSLIMIRGCMCGGE